MDLNLVYAKTEAGEQAVQERTRLVQRNLRNVLIMVDGHRTVQELCDKIGKAMVVESALEQLERDGYVRPLLEQPSVWDMGQKVVDEFREFAGEKLSGLRGKPMVPVYSSEPAEETHPEPEPPSEPEYLPEPAATVIEPSPFVGQPSTEQAPSPFASPTQRPSTAAAPEEKPAGGLLRGLLKSGKAGKSESRDDSALPVKEVADDKVDIKPIRRGRRRGPGAYGWLGIAVVGLLVLMVVAVFAFPYSVYQADIEAGLSKTLGQPVKIGAVRGNLSPTPVLVLEHVQIGEGGDIIISEASATPTVASLFGSPRVFREVAISGIKVPAERLSTLIPGITRLAQGESFSARHVTIRGAEISLRDVLIADLSGEIDAGEDGRNSRLLLKNADGTLHLEFAPGESGVAASIEVSNWKPVDGAPFVWDAMAVKGILAGASFTGNNLEGRLFDGIVQGQMQFDWGGADIALRADFGVEQASAKRVSEGLGSDLSLDGEVNGRIRVTASAERMAGLRERAALEGEFTMRRGVVNGIDFVESVRRTTNSAARGGSTRFDQLSGRWIWSGKVLRVNAIDGASGALQTTGSLTVGAGQKVDGGFDVRLKGSATELRAAVTLAGTLRDPQLHGGRR